MVLWSVIYGCRNKLTSNFCDAVDKMAQKDWLKFGIPAVLLLALLLFFMREKKDKFSQQPEAAPVEQKPAVVILPQNTPPPTENEIAKQAKRVVEQRASFEASMAYGAHTVVPTRAADGSFAFAVNYQPVSKGCSEGDVDLIAKVLPPKGMLRFTIDSDTDRSPLHSKEMAVSALQQPFKVNINIPATSQAKVYRVTLCSDLQNSGDCKRANPAPMTKMSAKKAEPPAGNLIFFAQTFVADSNGIKFLDNLRQGLMGQTLNPGKAFGQHLADSAYLNQLPAINAMVKPIPTTFANNTLNVTMYYRDIEVCKSLGAR